MSAVLVRSLCFFAVGIAFVTEGRVRAEAPPPLGVTLIPHGSTFSSFRNYAQTVRVDRLTIGKTPVTSAELEIRFPSQKLRMVRSAYPWGLGREVHDRRIVRIPNASSDQLQESALRQLGDAPPGEYQLALYLNGVRASNVVSIRIDPGYDAAAAPVLALAAIEPHPLAKRAQVVLFARGPVPTDPELTNISLYGAPFRVDGVERKRANLFWIGLSGPIRSGDLCWFQADFADYQPPIDPDRPCVVEFGFGKYVAAPLRFDPAENRLSREWDTMVSAEWKDAPRRAVSVQGTVRDTGTGAAIYRVALREPNQGDIHEEFTDEHGRFQFAGLAPGTYTVSCAPLNGEPYGYSKTQPETVTVEAGGTGQMTLQFRTWRLKKRP